MSASHRLEPALADLDVEPALTAARAGDGEAFRALMAPHLRALHAHCYRMLGSYTDAEEAVQEATLRAWRGLHGYQGHWPVAALAVADHDHHLPQDDQSAWA